MLSQRILFGALLIAALIGLIFADQMLPPAYNGLIVTIVVAALTLLATLELGRLLHSAGHHPHLLWPLLINIALVCTPYFALSQKLDGHTGVWFSEQPLISTLLVLTLAGTFLAIAVRRRTERAIADIATSLFLVIYLGLCLSFLVRLRMHAPGRSVLLVLFFVATVKISDIGAYFTGYFLGKHKMIPWLSPKKTWEGLAGGILASIIMAIVFPLIAGHGDLAAGLKLGLTYPVAVLFGILMAVVGQAGDLLESLIKRDAQAKDSAAAVPAFGGVLDIIDSLLLTAPIAYWMLVK